MGGEPSWDLRVRPAHLTAPQWCSAARTPTGPRIPRHGLRLGTQGQALWTQGRPPRDGLQQGPRARSPVLALGQGSRHHCLFGRNKDININKDIRPTRMVTLTWKKIIGFGNLRFQHKIEVLAIRAENPNFRTNSLRRFPPWTLPKLS